ncbi:hypothetical protein BCR39DRAFT_600209 [Naematelia encephala]|uniref:BTB domain-containing protein n=1 Tax=Naematelia encephala TaxID=71784 RepID=A0A1Y2ATH8_9TREE|nr:hypothetical protein BCR39DRAFT_600209 [Naematelia encephala]
MSEKRLRDSQETETQPGKRLRHSQEIPTVKLVQDKVYVEGDIKMISSDNVMFALSHRLSESRVFRSKLSMGTKKEKKELYLIEIASIISLALDVLTPRWFPNFTNDNLSRLDGTFCFLKKYDCYGPVDFLRGCLRTTVYLGTGSGILDTDRVFTVAAKHGFYESCRACIEVEQQSKTTEEPQIYGNVPGTSLLSPATTDIHTFRKIPHDYLWALSRSTYLGSSPADTAQHFERLIKDCPSEMTDEDCL